jgi:hypothetical protein
MAVFNGQQVNINLKIIIKNAGFAGVYFIYTNNRKTTP